MKYNYPPLRLSPAVAGKMAHDHQLATRKLRETERFLTALTTEIRNAFGTETVWALQAKARNAIALTDLQKELRA